MIDGDVGIFWRAAETGGPHSRVAQPCQKPHHMICFTGISRHFRLNYRTLDRGIFVVNNIGQPYRQESVMAWNNATESYRNSAG